MLGQRHGSRLADALHRGGHNRVGFEGLIHVNADHEAVVRGSSRNNGGEHGAAAGEDDFRAGLVPAGDHSLQLGGSGEGSAVLPGVLELNLNAQLLRRSAGALREAVAIAVARSVGTAAAAGEAQLGEAVLHDGVAGEVARLLLLEGDRGDVGERSTRFIVQNPAVDEDEVGFREFDRSPLERFALHEAGANDDFRAALGSRLHGVIAVIIRRFVAVGGLIVLVGQLVGRSVGLHAVPGALVEGLVLELSNVGDERDLVRAVGRGNGIRDVIGVHGIGQSNDVAQRQRHDQKHRKKLFHGGFLLIKYSDCEHRYYSMSLANMQVPPNSSGSKSLPVFCLKKLFAWRMLHFCFFSFFCAANCLKPSPITS